MTMPATCSRPLLLFVVFALAADGAAAGTWRFESPRTHPETLVSLSGDGSGNLVAVGADSAVVVSNDGGRSWKLGRLGGRDHLLSVAMLPGQSVLAVGTSGTVWRSEDGGLGWRPQALFSATTLRGIFFVHPAVGWAVGDMGAIFLSRDAGRLWGRLSQ
ncbi:MAG: hypothetical protein D6806_16175, partial [Deltaproteobacteria bacterium]